jgi:hypothetical protein
VRAFAHTRRFAACLGIAASLLGCARPPSPAPLRGTWYSEDVRYDGRTLVIHTHWIRFMDGPNEVSAIRVDQVAQEGALGGDGPVRFEIEGVDRDGLPSTLTLELVQRPIERLRLETQQHAWRRTPREERAS